MPSRLRAIVTAVVLVFAGAPSALPQTTAQVTGAITDPSGAMIPGARVTALNIDTGDKRVTRSNEAGYYSIPLLPPGRYEVSVESEGFKSLTRSGITLQVNQVARLDFTLELGAIAEHIHVAATAPLVERETAALGAVISNEKIGNLPLNGRNPFVLTLLVPGVTPTTDDISRGVPEFHHTGNIQVNGGRGNTSAFLIDGVNNTTSWAESFNTVPNIPSVEAVQEFKVHTNSFSAEFGRTGGGAVNVVIKSGTNSFRGVVYEFLRNSRMDANDFFANRAGASLMGFKRNQFGASLGGPIVKDRLFFFVNYEGIRQRAASNSTNTVPTAVQRAGNFSETSRRVGGRCVPLSLYDPATTRRAASGAGFVRDPFSRNVIPPSRLDPVAVRMLELYPASNLPGDSCTGIQNFFSAKSDRLNTDQMDIRSDFIATQRDRLSIGLSWRERDRVPPNHYGTIASPSNPSVSDPSKGARVNYVRIQSPTLLLNVAFGVNRVQRTIPPREGVDLVRLGFPKSLEEQMTKPISIPNLAITGYGATGTKSMFAFLADNSYNWSGSATWIRGRHNLKFGGELRIMQDYEHTGFGTSGEYSFGPAFTQGPDPNAPAGDRGDGLASLLLGFGTGDVQIIPGVLTSNRYFGLFVQDDIKVTPKLTLNIGLRYDVENGRKERNNKLSFFDFDAPSPLSSKVPSMPGLRGGLRFVGVDADRQFDTDKNNFGPRIGLAYSMNPKTVIRTGYGIFYLPFIGGAAGAGAGIGGFQAFTPWVSSLDGLTPVNPLSNAFPGGLNRPTGSALGLSTNVGMAFGLTDREGVIVRNARVGYMQQWNFNVQRELPFGLSFEAAYAGSKGTKLPNGPRGHQMNQLRPEQLTMRTALQELVTNPFYGTITAAGPLAEPMVTRGQLLRPYPQFLGLLNLRPDSASSIYHSFQMRVQKQFSAGLTFIAAYTNAKLISDSDNIVTYLGQVVGSQNAYDRRADRSLAGEDISQRLVFSYVYELPVGRGKRFGAHLPKWASFAVGNWKLNGITSFTAGSPVAGPTATNNSQSFSDLQRGNAVRDPYLLAGRPTSEKLARWFDPAAFSQPAAFTFGNGPRILPNVRGDGDQNFDASLFKEFPFSEEKRLEFRAEAFNLFNTPQFGFPGITVGSNAFGVVTSQRNIPRQLQLGLRLRF